MKLRKVTYRLMLDEVQRAYVRQEIQKAQVMYRFLLKEVWKQQGVCVVSKQSILTRLQSYEEHYGIRLCGSERKRMLEKLWLHRVDDSQLHTYMSEYCLEHFHYRNMPIFPFLKPRYYWQREPLIFHWEIVYSAIFMKQRECYVILYFIKKF